MDNNLSEIKKLHFNTCFNNACGYCFGPDGTGFSRQSSNGSMGDKTKRSFKSNRGGKSARESEK